MSADTAPVPRPVPPETPAAPLELPSPEQLGIGSPRSQPAAELDWNAVHRRLRELGALSSQLQKVPEGGYRFTCLLPTAHPERTQRIEAHATSESEAARLALARAEQWIGQSR